MRATKVMALLTCMMLLSVGAVSAAGDYMVIHKTLKEQVEAFPGDLDELKEALTWSCENPLNPEEVLNLRRTYIRFYDYPSWSSRYGQLAAYCKYETLGTGTTWSVRFYKDTFEVTNIPEWYHYRTFSHSLKFPLLSEYLSSPDPTPFCGDGIVNQFSEECDDGNNVNGDACSGTCQWETLSPICPAGYHLVPLACGCVHD